jgi:hypothetical protein
LKRRNTYTRAPQQTVPRGERLHHLGLAFGISCQLSSGRPLQPRSRPSPLRCQDQTYETPRARTSQNSAYSS